MSLLNFVSFTSNRLSSLRTECGSAPTSSRNSRPNNSKHILQRPRMKLADTCDASGTMVVFEEVEDVDDSP